MIATVGPGPSGYLRACLLLLLAESPAHGYQLRDRVCELGARPDTAALYRALRALEEDGLVSSWWEPTAAGPARRLYRLTEAGGERLEALAGDVVRHRRCLCAYLRRHQRLPRPLTAEAMLASAAP